MAREGKTFLNGLVGALTAGIYIPRTIQVRCATGRADLYLNEDELRRITSDPMFVDWVEAVLPSRVTDVVAARAAHPQGRRGAGGRSTLSVK